MIARGGLQDPPRFVPGLQKFGNLGMTIPNRNVQGRLSKKVPRGAVYSDIQKMEECVRCCENSKSMQGELLFRLAVLSESGQDR